MSEQFVNVEKEVLIRLLSTNQKGVRQQVINLVHQGVETVTEKDIKQPEKAIQRYRFESPVEGYKYCASHIRTAVDNGKNLETAKSEALLPIDEFYVINGKPHSYCKSCSAEKAKAHKLTSMTDEEKQQRVTELQRRLAQYQQISVSATV